MADDYNPPCDIRQLITTLAIACTETTTLEFDPQEGVTIVDARKRTTVTGVNQDEVIITPHVGIPTPVPGDVFYRGDVEEKCAKIYDFASKLKGEGLEKICQQISGRETLRKRDHDDSDNEDEEDGYYDEFETLSNEADADGRRETAMKTVYYIQYYEVILNIAGYRTVTRTLTKTSFGTKCTAPWERLPSSVQRIMETTTSTIYSSTTKTITSTVVVPSSYLMKPKGSLTKTRYPDTEVIVTRTPDTLPVATEYINYKQPVTKWIAKRSPGADDGARLKIPMPPDDSKREANDNWKPKVDAKPKDDTAPEEQPGTPTLKDDRKPIEAPNPTTTRGSYLDEISVTAPRSPAKVPAVQHGRLLAREKPACTS